MKFCLMLAALISFQAFAVEVSPAQLRQLQMSADNLLNQAEDLRNQIASLNRQPSEPQVFTGTCTTAQFESLGGEDCNDLQAVLRRPRLSPEVRADIEGAISCARREAMQSCQVDNRGFCELLPGYVSKPKENPSTGLAGGYIGLYKKCQVTVQARVR